MHRLKMRHRDGMIGNRARPRGRIGGKDRRERPEPIDQRLGYA